MLRHLANFTTPLHVAVHQTPFRWTETEDKAYEALKIMLSQAPVVQPPDWTRPFHVFVDASDIAIATYNAQLVSTSKLLKPEVVYRLKELFNNRARSPRDDIQHKQIPTLPIRQEVHISRGPRSPPLPRLQTSVNREIGSVDAALGKNLTSTSNIGQVRNMPSQIISAG